MKEQATNTVKLERTAGETGDKDVVGRQALAQRFDVDARTVDRMVARGELPKPCLGQRGRPRWLWSYVVEFLRNRHERQADLNQKQRRKTT